MLEERRKSVTKVIVSEKRGKRASSNKDNNQTTKQPNKPAAQQPAIIKQTQAGKQRSKHPNIPTIQLANNPMNTGQQCKMREATSKQSNDTTSR